MFTNLYLGELKKSFSKVFTIVFAAIFLIIFAVITISIYSIYDDFTDSDFPPGPETIENLTAEDVDLLIMVTEAQIIALEAQKKKQGFNYYKSSYDELYLKRGELNYYKYIQEKNLYDKPSEIYTGLELGGLFGMSGAITADGYVTQMLMIMSSILMFYGIVVASGSFSKEYREGTIKILFLRSVTRTKLLLAKALSVLTISTAAYIISFILAVILGYSLFPSQNVDTMFSFNGGAFSVASNNFQLFIAFFIYYIEMMSMIAIAFFAGTLLRNRIWGIVVPVVLSSMGQMIVFTGLARFFITDAINFSQYAGLHAMVTTGGNFFISLAVYLLYMGGLGAVTYLSVIKRDLA